MIFAEFYFNSFIHAVPFVSDYMQFGIASLPLSFLFIKLLTFIIADGPSNRDTEGEDHQ